MGSRLLKPGSEWNRRDFLKLGTALTGGALYAGMVSGQISVATNSTKEILAEYLRRGFGVKNQLTIWWQRGVSYAETGNKRIPLHGIEQAIFACRTGALNDRPRLLMFSLTYVTDLHHHAILHTLRNPLTGKIHRVAQERSALEIFVPTLTSFEPINAASPGAGKCSRSNRVAIKRLSQQQFCMEFSCKDRTSASTGVTSLVVPATQPPAPNQHCPTSLVTQSQWPEWMHMNDRAGWVHSEMHGARFLDPADLPDSFVEKARRIHPWVIRNPQDWLNVKIKT